MIEPLKDLSGLDINKKVIELESYIRRLCDHLNWQFENLDEENFNKEYKGE